MTMFGSQWLANAGGAGYEIENSLRLDGTGDMSRTVSSNGNLRTWTFSFWLKRSTFGTNGGLGFNVGGTYVNASNRSIFRFHSTISGGDDDWYWAERSGGAWREDQATTIMYRDPSAWSHYMCVWDTDGGTTPRARRYVNGESVDNYLKSGGTAAAANVDSGTNQAGTFQLFDQAGFPGREFEGYCAEMHFVDGTALGPSSFGETNDDGVWVPIEYTGSYGSNGFYLDFADSSDLGKDVSGNGNDFTTSGLTAADQMGDTPTNNFWTLNPTDPHGSNVNILDGNLRADCTSSAEGSVFAPMLPETGKWAWKITATLNMGSGAEYPVLVFVRSCNADLVSPMRAGGTGEGYGADGRFFSASAGSNSSYGAAWADGDVIEVGWDADNGTLSFWHNGSAQGVARSGLTGRWKPAQDHYSTAGGDTLSDFGQSGYSPTDSSYKTLCTANLATPSIKDGSKYFQTTLYTGNGTAIGSGGLEVNQSGNSTFQPDFAWIKNRTTSGNEHDLYDAVRGVTKVVFSSTAGAEATVSEGLTSFDTDGFTVGNRGEVNTSGNSMVAWQWLANGSGSSNTDGSINTTATSVNTTAGFSISKYDGSGSNATVGHGLGIAPKMVIVKELTDSRSWVVYHEGIGDAAKVIYLDQTAAAGTDATVWNSTAPTSTVFSVGTANGSNGSGNTYIAYAFAEIPGYSSIGSYEGNGSTDGTFVYTGFKPSFILTKNIDTTDQWGIRDAARNPFNVTDKLLNPNASTAETSSTTGYIDILSNGFKPRSSDSNINTQTIIYMAFAENPFGGDGVAPATAR